MGEPESDPVRAAERLAESFEGFTSQLSRLHRSGTRNRVVSGVLALVVAALGWVAWQQRETQARLQQVQAAIHANQVAACAKANADRKRDAAVWHVILKAPPHASAAVRAELVILAGLVRRKDAPRDCAALYATNR